MNIRGTTKVCGIIGNPIKHSMSPIIHNYLAKVKGLDLVYVPFETTNAVAAVAGAYELNVLGMNVTVPHKNAVIPQLKEIDSLAANIGAVNTLVRVDGGFKGYNTDILGLKRQLELENVPLKDMDVVIVGAGGAARAVAFLCASEKVKSLTILNRTVSKAEEIANNIKQVFEGFNVSAYTINDYSVLENEKKYVVIQTTNVGLHPNNLEAPIYDKTFYDRVLYGVDIIYNPSKTKFMQLVNESGGQSFGGIKMLLYQGVLAFELWTGTSVSEEEANEVLQLLKKELNIDE